MTLALEHHITAQKDGMPTTTRSQNHFLCLDMLHISWVNASGRAICGCAILTEVWSSGAVLQTETAIPEDSMLTLSAPYGQVCAKVATCRQDDYGFLITTSVDPSEHWFPDSYCPADLIPSSSARPEC
jgi:hypothetical protein